LIPTVYGVWHKLTGSLSYDITNNSIALDGGAASDASLFGYYENSTGSGSTRVYFNTFKIYGGVDNFDTYAFYRGTANNHTVKNNILINDRASGGLGNHIALANSYGSPSVNFTSDYNVIKSTNSSNEFVWGTDIYDFVTYKSFSSMDDNSLNFTPVFKSSTDNHLDTNYNCQLNGKGTVIASVTSDIDGQVRNASKPDIGFDELPYMPYGKWFGYYSSAWNSSTNWCDVVVPTTTSDVEIDGTANYQPIITTGVCNWQLHLLSMVH
ncbi:MAG: hypothetical protein HYZ42_07375, partial [Bacteroidetes bacterium]|nr:hypothetical protein [Bacteroidota bacterium]